MGEIDTLLRGVDLIVIFESGYSATNLSLIYFPYSKIFKLSGVFMMNIPSGSSQELLMLTSTVPQPFAIPASTSSYHTVITNAIEYYLLLSVDVIGNVKVYIKNLGITIPSYITVHINALFSHL